MRQYREEFVRLDKRCEFPHLGTGEQDCAENAWHVYITDWSFIFICTNHRDYIKSLPQSKVIRVDMRIAEILWALMCRRSYVFMNEASNYELDDLVNEYQENLRKAAERPAAQRRAAERKIREEIAAQSVKIGAPDDSLLEERSGKTIIRNNETKKDETKPVSTAGIPLFLPDIRGLR